eukprot:908404-Rhodomonas_salina.1
MEVAKLDVCDVLWDFDGLNTLAMLLCSRKNDGMKRGLFPRMGRGSTPATCPLVLIREYMERAGIHKSPLCTKQKPGWTRSPCEACGRLFRNTTAGGRQMEGPRRSWVLSKNVVRAAVK